MKKGIGLLMVILGLLPSAAFAGDFVPYLGVYGTYTSVFDTPPPEGFKDGMGYGAKLVGSWDLNQSFLDLAAGYQYEKVSGAVDVETKSALAQLDWRIKTSSSFSIGPVATVQFGSDNSRAEVQGGDTTLVLGGLKMMYQTSSVTPFRIELAVQRSIDGDGIDSQRDIYITSLGFQFALGSQSDPNKKSQPTPPPSPAPRPQPVQRIIVERPVIVEKDVILKDVKLNLSQTKLNFKHNGAVLDDKSKLVLSDLAQVMKNDPDAYKVLNITGHTDNLGSHEYNQTLSEQRANAVKAELIAQGISEDKLMSQGKSFDEPLDSANSIKARAKNRRTELKFIELKQGSLLENKVNSLSN